MTAPNTSVRKPNATVDCNFTSSSIQDGYHHPLHISWPDFVDSISTWTFQAFRATGLSLHGSGFEDATLQPVSQHRESSQTGFLKYAMRTTTIKGVLVQSGSKDYTLSATREVILSAGAFQSPQLWMLSSVGPQETLQQHNIPVLASLSGVGQNLQDQPLVGISHRVNVPTSSKLANDPLYAAQAATSYLSNGTGPLAGPPGLLAFERISSTCPSLLPNTTLASLEKAFPSD
ncbi:hypothetical protein MBLNU13_g02840t1 [Cladosporium sp. NU13]